MLQALARAVADLANRRVFTIMLQTLGIAVAIFVLLGLALGWLLQGLDPCNALGVGTCTLGTGESTIGALVLTLFGAWFLFPAVAITVVTGFSDRIADAVERAHYPEAAQLARPIGLGRGLLSGLKSGARLIVFNVLALPFYVLLLVTGVGPFILFVIVNGIALGRDLGELAAARHGDRQSRRAWLTRTRGQQHLIGLVVSVLFLVPIVNMLAPIIGIAAAIHLVNASSLAATPSRRSFEGADPPRSKNDGY